MRILQVIQKPQRRGAEIFAIQLSEGLQTMGHEVMLVSIFKNENELVFSGRINHLNRPLEKRFYDWFGWRAFALLIKEFQPDLIQLNAADTLKFGVFSKLLFGWRIPLVYRNANMMGNFIKGVLHRKFNQFLLNKVDGIASVSESSKNDLIETFDHSYKVHEAITIAIVNSDIEQKIDRNTEISLPENFVIQIGGLVPEKDPIGMLGIFQTLERPDLNLVFLGSGKLESQLERLINERELADRVKIIPNQSNIFPILRRARALILPSKIEGLPGVILEAMYCKVPVVAYDVGGISEVLSGNTGWLVPTRDVDSFLLAIEEVLNSNQKDLDRKLECAKNLVEKEYNLPQVTSKFEDFYRKVIDTNA
ncbi:glycosyltransferase [Algoriphagus sediminis]|uniref:Glycosyltransferase n=1 Tax=Algoriphagus sediminis TaxID=3057113 RepID=A0ABT7YEB5_9BACT|nr:glycosyltransferase [Algoriphagus sediminis]MDN3204690.1 glycosyltransferase [Algoriphagus sediminis]